MTRPRARIVSICLVMSFLLAPSTVSAFGAPNLTSDINAILASITEFNSNTSKSTSATTLSAYQGVLKSNKRILSNIDAELVTFSKDLNQLWKQLPQSDNKYFPARQNLKDYLDALRFWLTIQQQDQVMAEKCQTDSRGFMNCLIANYPNTSAREQDAGLRVRAPYQKLVAWSNKYRVNK